MTGPLPWWRPEVFGQHLPILRRRADIKASVRGYFLARAFDEVETPILQVSPGNETHIGAIKADLLESDGTVSTRYLHTSPEFSCKKLLAAGLSRIFTLAPVFRTREHGRLHHPQFLMLEWYRAGASLSDLMADCAALLRVVAEAAGTPAFRHRDVVVEATADPDVLTVVDAFRRHAGIDLEAMLPPQPCSFVRLAAETEKLGLRVAADDGWSDLFSKILSARVEPCLGLEAPTFLTRYPISEAALAQPCPDDPRFADRFELYVCGVELANAFDELRDPREQRRRFQAAETERARIYGETYPIDEDFLAALSIMPPACGIALGFDRIVMLATGAATIDDVLWAPVHGSALESPRARV